MQDVEIKIKQIKNSVIRSAGAEKKLLLGEAEQNRDCKMSALNESLEADFASEIEKYKKTLELERKRRISKALLDSKHMLVSERNTMTESVFESVKNKIIEFCKDEQLYKQYLIDGVLDCLNECVFESPVLCLRQEDLKFGEEINSCCRENLAQRVDDSIEIGGFKLYSPVNSIVIDHSFGELLSLQRDEFMTYCTLSIR